MVPIERSAIRSNCIPISIRPRCSINLADKDGLPPIWIGLTKPRSTFEYVLQAKPKLDISCYSDKIDWSFFFSASDLVGFVNSGLSVHYPLLLGAIATNNYDFVDLLLKAGMPIDRAVVETHKNSKTGKQVTTKSVRNPTEFGIQNNYWSGIAPVINDPRYKGTISEGFLTLGYYIASGKLDQVKRQLLNYTEDTRDLEKIAIDSHSDAALRFLLAYNAKDISVFRGEERLSPFHYAVITENYTVAKQLVPKDLDDILTQIDKTALQMRLNENEELVTGNLAISYDLYERLLGSKLDAFDTFEFWGWYHNHDLYVFANAMSVIMGLDPAYEANTTNESGNIIWTIRANAAGFQIPDTKGFSRSGE